MTKKKKMRPTAAMDAFGRGMTEAEFWQSWNELLRAFSEGDADYILRGHFETDLLARYAGHNEVRAGRSSAQESVS
jgi:hypothetical protein